jgi:hypothetical protein
MRIVIEIDGMERQTMESPDVNLTEVSSLGANNAGAAPVALVEQSPVTSSSRNQDAGSAPDSKGIQE